MTTWKSPEDRKVEEELERFHANRAVEFAHTVAETTMRDTVEPVPTVKPIDVIADEVRAAAQAEQIGRITIIICLK